MKGSNQGEKNNKNIKWVTRWKVTRGLNQGELSSFKNQEE